MPPLNNARHEKFVGFLLEGKSATDAHEQAGYVRDDGNATRLRANPKVQERLAELQAEVAKEAKVTVEGLIAELEDARVKASNLDQLSAAVRAIEAKAKVSGILVQKVEVGGPGDFSKCDTVEAVVDEVLTYSLNPYQPHTERDRQALIAMYERHYAGAQELIASIKARPIAGVRADSGHQLGRVR